MKTLTSIVSLCLCLLGAVDVKASTNNTHYLTTPHIVNATKYKSYRLDTTYSESSVLFINKMKTNLTIRMNNGSMFFVIAPGKSAMFWRNGKLWMKGYST